MILTLTPDIEMVAREIVQWLDQQSYLDTLGIMRLARRANFECDEIQAVNTVRDLIAGKIAAAITAERDRCEKIAHNVGDYWDRLNASCISGEAKSAAVSACEGVEEQIRNRGDKDVVGEPV